MLPFGKHHRAEAVRLMRERLAVYREKSYADLTRLMNEPDHFDAHGENGQEYQIEIFAVWDDKAKGDLRVCASIDDGWLTAYVNTKPFLDDFIIRSDGTFVGEDPKSV